MIDFKDILGFLVPVPPFVLKSSGSFPDCATLFCKIANNPKEPKYLGRIFALVCRLTGFAWFVWLLNSLIFLTIVFIVAYHWGCAKDLTQKLYFDSLLSGRMIIAISASGLFVAQCIYHGLNRLSNHFSSLCIEYVTGKRQ